MTTGAPFRIETRDAMDEIIEVLQFSIERVQRYDLPAGKQQLSLWDRMAKSWSRSRREMFESAGASVGTPWIPYNNDEDQYEAFKSRIFGRRMTVYDVLRWDGSDRLMRSFVEPTSPYYVRRQGPRAFEVGSSLSYASKHDLGVGTGPRWAGGYPLPRRPLLTLGPRLRQDWTRDTLAYAVDLGNVIGRQLTGASARALPLRR
jgi:phage gpG-like protein